MNSLKILYWAIRNVFWSVYFICFLVPLDRASFRCIKENPVSPKIRERYEEKRGFSYHNIGVLRRSTYNTSSHFNPDGFLAKMFRGLSNKLAIIEDDWRC
ncbi:hypothetical protein LCGC14_2942500 [marine sediment metagenome]|uniref:Uncharacterized protein n=1 Tax=marine sediment metagenome TaxID=412755 RepID=A0A0F8XI60_9ZZZZ